jgi:hypothetical protein
MARGDRPVKTLWIDPGENVGWAKMDVHPAGLGYYAGENGDEGGCRPMHTLELVDYGNTKMQAFALNLRRTAAQYDVIGFEPYYIDPSKLLAHAGSDVPTLQLVGMIRLAVWEAQAERKDGRPRIEESPRTRKTRGLGAVRLYLPDFTDIVLEALHGPHDDGHYGDAILHGAAWYYDQFGNKPHAVQS